MTDTTTPKVETLESQTYPLPASYDRWMVVSWWGDHKTWFTRNYDNRKQAQEAYSHDSRDEDFGVVKLLWVSESGRPEPESGVVDDA